MISNLEYYWYKLFSVKGIGNKALHSIYSVLEKEKISMKDFFTLNEREFRNKFSTIYLNNHFDLDYNSLRSLEEEKIDTHYNKLKEENIDIITLESNIYPQRLTKRMQENSPAILFCKGYLHLLRADSIAIVGSRNVEDLQIIQRIKQISKELSLSGFNIISGYAKGVDITAHVSALESGGTTTFILSHGFNHLSIKREIYSLDWKKSGLFISQFAPYEKFTGYNAMKRNKLTCSLSDKVVVISSGPEKDENGKMSGTFDSGVSALRLKIPLYVLSPALFKVPPKGNIDLIKRGGIEFRGTEEILENENTTTSNVQTNEVILQKTNKKKKTTSQLEMFKAKN